MVKKVNNFVEVSEPHFFMWLPANANGYKIFLENGGLKEFESLFIKKKKVIIKKKRVTK